MKQRHSATLAVTAVLLLAPLLALAQARPTQPPSSGATPVGAPPTPVTPLPSPTSPPPTTPTTPTTPRTPVAPPQPPIAKPPQPARPGAAMLAANQFVPSGSYMLSPNQWFVGIMQDDGRFCVYHGKNPAQHGPLVRCAPATPLSPPAKFHMEMRSDGNLCFARGAAPVPHAPQAANVDTHACLPGQPPRANAYAAYLTDGGNLELHATRAGAPGLPYWSLNALPMPKPVGGPGSLPPAPVAAAVLNLMPPTARPAPLGAARGGPPALAAYVVDASGKRDEKVAQVVCPGQCSLRAPVGARVEIASSAPVRAWTGECATHNMSSEPTRKCVVTLRPLPNNAPLIVGASQ